MKFEFGDLYKFTVSLGVVLISLAILAPWLFLKESFDLFKTTAELSAVTDVAHAVILKRQASVAFILRIIPWFSGLCFVLGAGAVSLGLKRWYANQLLLDEQTRIEVELKKVALRDATPDEVAIAEVLDFQSLEALRQPTSQSGFMSFSAKYREIEGLVVSRLQPILTSKYDIEPNKRIGGHEIDLLLRGLALLTKDVIVEIKWTSRGFNYGWLREAFLRNIYSKTVYAQVTNRIPNTLLLIVAEVQGEDLDEYAPMLKRVTEEGFGRKGKDVVVMLTKDELLTLSSEQLQSRLGVWG